MPKRNLKIENKIKKQIRKLHEDSQAIFTRDRSLSVGASEVFKCQRQVAITKLLLRLYKERGEAMPIPEEGGYMLRGSTMENVFISKVAERAWKKKHGLGNLSGEQETVVSPDTEYLTATPDGLAKDFQLEFKTHDPRKRVKDKPDPDHVRQCHVQMGIFGRKKTYLIYFNCSDWYDVTTWEINFDEKVYKKAVDRANKIMQAVEAGDFTGLYKEGVLMDSCGLCVHKDICDTGELSA